MEMNTFFFMEIHRFNENRINLTGEKESWVVSSTSSYEQFMLNIKKPLRNFEECNNITYY